MKKIERVIAASEKVELKGYVCDWCGKETEDTRPIGWFILECVAPYSVDFEAGDYCSLECLRNAVAQDPPQMRRGSRAIFDFTSITDTILERKETFNF